MTVGVGVEVVWQRLVPAAENRQVKVVDGIVVKKRNSRLLSSSLHVTVNAKQND